MRAADAARVCRIRFHSYIFHLFFDFSQKRTGGELFLLILNDL